MKRPLSATELEILSTRIADLTGLHFPPSRWRSLEHSISTAAGDMGFPDTRECAAWFTSAAPSRELVESMADYLTIGESYFLREPRCFEVLEHRIIPDIIQKRRSGERHLRIWSSGCSTGEEPYSIAILLYRLRSTLPDWRITILATDINPVALRKARGGIYTEWSFRKVPAGFKKRYFRSHADGRYELLPAIREMVTFARFNLAADCYPSADNSTAALDVIFCRNVLMYFTPHYAAQVVAGYHSCLLENGWLVVSPCDTPNSCFSGFTPVNFSDAILFQKGASAKAASGNDAGFAVVPTLRFPEMRADPLPDNREQAGTGQQIPALQQSGNWLENSEKLLREEPDSSALTQLCRLHADQGRLGEALGLVDRALAGDRLSAGLHCLRATILQEQGRHDEAAAALRKALYLDRDLVLAHFTLANLAQRRGDLDESRRHFANALSLLDTFHPDDIIPESEGMSAGGLGKLIRTITVPR